MNQARHANCYQGDQEHPTASALRATEEGDTRMLVGAEPPEKGPGHDSLLLSTPHYCRDDGATCPEPTGCYSSTQPPPKKRPALEYFPRSTGQCLSTDHRQHSICEVTLSTDRLPCASAIGKLSRECTILYH